MAQVLHGDASANQLNARNDKTQLYGLAGNDTLTSDGKSNVLLVGGSGDDSLIMTGGDGTLSGGNGADTFELTYSTDKKLSAVIEDLDPATDKIIVHFDGTTAPQLSSSVSGNDVILRDGELLNVTIKGVRENDYLNSNVSNEAWKVLELTNAERENQNLAPLTASYGLTRAAQIRANEISALGESGALTNHTRPNGLPYYTVLDGKYNFPGENLDGGATSPEEVLQDWIDSDSHRENILNANYKKLGVGYYENDTDTSDQRFYWTQLFADSLKAQEIVDVSNSRIATNTVSKFVTLTENPDTYSNSDYGVTIQAKGGGDSIQNTGLIVSISGGNDNDTIDNRGNFSTINAGNGNDSINLNAQEVLIQYALGDGNDTISGINSTDTVSISGSSFTPATVGNDLILAVGSDSITLTGAIKSGVQVVGEKSKIVILTNNDDTLENTTANVTIDAKGGDDSISNYAADVFISGGADSDSIYNSATSNNVSINGGAGNDSIGNHGNDVTITGGAGNDTVLNYGVNPSVTSHAYGSNASILTGDGDDSVRNNGSYSVVDGGEGSDTLHNTDYSFNSTILGGSGSDSIRNDGSNASIDSGAGDDSIRNYGASVTIDSSDGNDYIYNDSRLVTIDAGAGSDSIDNYRAQVTIDGGAGNDTVYNHYGNSLCAIDGSDGNDNITNDGASVSIDGGQGNDSITNYDYGALSTISGGADNDYIYNVGASVSIDGGAGNDYIDNGASNDTINGGKGNDTIYLSIYSPNALIQYAPGDGNDTIQGANSTATLRIGNGRDTYSMQRSSGDYIIKVGRGSIRLVSSATINIEGTQREPNEADNTLITLTEGNDTYQNTLEGMTISALGGDDSIDNSGEYVSILGGNGDDTVLISGANSSISGDGGNDSIALTDSAKNILISYVSGDGNDTVSGFKENDTLRALRVNEYSTVASGNDVIVTVGDESVTLLDAATLTSKNIFVNWLNPPAQGKVITLSEDNDNYQSSVKGVMIEALGGNDTIVNGYNRDKVTISGGAGNDSISNDSDRISIDSGAGADTVSTYGENVTISAGEGSDSIFAYGTDKKIDLGAGDDWIHSSGANTTIAGGSGSDSISNYGASSSIDGGAGDDDISNSGANSTVDGGLGDDDITNWSDSVSVNGGAGDDSIYNEQGNSVTIRGSAGDDVIQLGISNEELVIEYASGDGNDTVRGFNKTDTLQIVNDKAYWTMNAGNDVMVGTPTGSILLRGAASLSAINIVAPSIRPVEPYSRVNLTNGDDIYGNNFDGVTIAALGGNDFVYNDGSEVSINGGAGDDYIQNEGAIVSIKAGAGDDTVDNYLSSGIVDLGAGNDSILNLSSNVSISGGDGNDYIEANAYNVSYAGTDSTLISPENITIEAGAGSDTVSNNSKSMIIDLGAGDDSIRNHSHEVTVNCGDGNDYVEGFGVDSSVLGGAGDDTFIGGSYSSNATIDGGAGDDLISLSSDAQNNFIRYTAGDGNDTIWGLSPNSSINFLNVLEGDFDSIGSGNDIILIVGDGSITLKDVRNNPPNVIIGESGTEGGGSGGGDGGGSSSGSGDGGRGGNDGGGSSGGTSGNEGMNSDASGSKSAIGSRGRSDSTNTNSGDKIISTVRKYVNYTAEAQQAINAIEYPTTAGIAATSTREVNLPNLNFTATQQVINQRVYSGGNQIISDYQSGEKIIFSEVYTGAFYDAANNFCVGSSTGALVIQNATDKVIDLSDAAGNDFLKAYAASTAGVIDGRGLAGFEIINGSAGADAIFAGDGGSQMWGGSDFAADTLVGGGGTDIFIGGRTQGADIFLNASSADIVHLNDASLSDIIATEENNGAIAIAFNTGNVVGVQSSELLSATVMLADGSAYRFNHSTKNWQTA